MHDANECRHVTVPRNWQSAQIVVENFVRNLHHRIIAAFNLLHQFQHAANIQRAEDEIHIRRPLQNLASGTLRDAAAHANQHVRAILFDAFEAAQFTVKFLVRFLADAARVEQHQIGLFHVIRQLVIRLLQQADNALRVVLIHLAAIGFDGKLLRSHIE